MDIKLSAEKKVYDLSGDHIPAIGDIVYIFDEGKEFAIRTRILMYKDGKLDGINLGGEKPIYKL